MNTNTRLKDRVCGMEVESNDISMDYRGIHYVFCSDQCLQRFQKTPHLYVGYPGSEAPKHAGMEVIKGRMIKLAEPLLRGEADKVTDHIEAMMGIQYVEVHEDRIEITYDLLEVTESQIEQTLSESGAVLGDTLTEKIRRAFVHYAEETEAKTLEARPSTNKGHHH